MNSNIPKGIHPECHYRVSLKAILRNKNNKVLLVKEKGSDWTLPGGGLDFGESLREGLERELAEEVAIKQSFSYQYVGIDSFYVLSSQRWQMWIVYEIRPEQSALRYGIGPDADEIAFIDPHQFRSSNSRSEQLVYKWCVDNSYFVQRFPGEVLQN